MVKLINRVKQEVIMKEKESPNKDCFKYADGGYNREFMASGFLLGMAFGKNIHDFKNGQAVMSINNEDDIVLAVKKAYVDMSPRTFEKNANWWSNPENVKLTKNGKHKDERTKEKEYAWQKDKKAVFHWLAHKFWDYFQNGCNNFDVWHNKLCEAFMVEFGSILNKHGYNGGESLKYGKAQKIINMTFKYLFCFNDAQEFADKFKPCHMPIDSYIINWYNDYNDEKCNTTWSNLSKTEYKKLQTNIKNLLGEHNPFLAEFYIWAEYNR